MRFIGIDPATTTGFVALDENGEVLVAESIKGKGKAVKGGITDEQRVSLENQLYNLLLPGDDIILEDAAVGTQRGITTGMIHGSLRSMIFRRGLIPNIVSPNAVKKYVGVSGWKGEKGSKVRLKDDEKKEAVKAAVLEHFGWTHKSHDVIDAYIMAQIALYLYKKRELLPCPKLASYQIEVIESILVSA
jgi:crossover junction endodeoxyribonuclease RuvC